MVMKERIIRDVVQARYVTAAFGVVQPAGWWLTRGFLYGGKRLDNIALVTCIAVTAALAVTIIGLVRMRSWARVAAIVMSCVSILACFLVGILSSFIAHIPGAIRSNVGSAELFMIAVLWLPLSIFFVGYFSGARAVAVFNEEG